MWIRVLGGIIGTAMQIKDQLTASTQPQQQKPAPPPSNPTPQSQKNITFRLAGTTFGQRQTALAHTRAYTPIILLREPANPHDRNAIAVCRAGDGVQLGYVPREMSQSLAPRIDSGTAYQAKLLRILGGGTGSHYGALIEVAPVQSQASSEARVCTSCHGRGELPCTLCHGKGVFEEGSTCTNCSGTGLRPCTSCSPRKRPDPYYHDSAFYREPPDPRDDPDWCAADHYEPHPLGTYDHDENERRMREGMADFREPD